MKNFIRPAVPLIAFMLIILLLWRGLSLHPSLVPSPLINTPAPEFQLPTLSDSPSQMTQKSFLGHVSLFNVWATWCAICANEHDFLLTLARDYHIIIYGLNYKDDPTAARKWLEQYGNPYQIVAIDESGETGINWGVYGTPETFIIDKKGYIRYKHVGALTPVVWQKTLQPIVLQLQGEAP